MAKAFIGSEALAAGTLTRHELQRWHRRIYPDVYLPPRPTSSDASSTPCRGADARN